MVDALGALQSPATTVTATTNGAGLVCQTPRRGLVARVLYSAASNASGSNSATFNIDYSPDGGSTWRNIGTAAAIALTTTAQAGEINIPFNTPLMTQPNTQAQVRLTCTIGGGGSTPTITYSCHIGSAMP